MSGPYGTVLARAFADGRRAWAAAEPILGEGGALLYFAGARFDRASLEHLGASVEIVPAPPLLARSGPLVIMTRR
jgi:hypothetical protein